jgi:hypothetical protein
MEVKNHLLLEVADDTKVASNMRGFLVFPGVFWCDFAESVGRLGWESIACEFCFVLSLECSAGLLSG